MKRKSGIHEIELFPMAKFRLTKDVIYLVIISSLLGLLGQVYADHFAKPKTLQPPVVYYNEDRKLNEELINLIQESNDHIYFAIYTFTLYDIKDALLGAKHRGVNVVGITDKKQTKDIPNQALIIKQLRDAGIPVYTQDHSAIMHLKALVTEKAYASGSYNWTASATNSNDEILEIGYDPTTREKYEKVLLEIFDRYK